MNTKGYRTLTFALLLGIFGAVEATLPGLQKLISPEMYGYGTVLVSVVVAVLRFVTTTAVGDSK